jgi:hypothetical protein
VGILYGSIDAEGWIHVDVIYEPPQQGTAENCMIIPSPHEESLVEVLATDLGLKKVGIIATHAPSELIVPSGEMLMSVELAKRSQAKNSEWVHLVVKSLYFYSPSLSPFSFHFISSPPSMLFTLSPLLLTFTYHFLYFHMSSPSPFSSG